MEDPISQHLDERLTALLRATGDARRRAFLDYCMLMIKAAEVGELTREQAAYQICGASAQVLDALTSKDREIMHVAGILELPEGQRGDASWSDLVGLVKKAVEE